MCKYRNNSRTAGEIRERSAHQQVSAAPGWMSAEFEMQMNPKSVLRSGWNPAARWCRLPACQSSHNPLSHCSHRSLCVAFSLSLLLLDSGCHVWITPRKDVLPQEYLSGRTLRSETQKLHNFHQNSQTRMWNFGGCLQPDFPLIWVEHC